MARKEIARSKGRRGPAPPDLPGVRMPGAGVMMIGGAATTPNSPQNVAPRRPTSGVMTMAFLPPKK